MSFVRNKFVDRYPLGVDACNCHSRDQGVHVGAKVPNTDGQQIWSVRHGVCALVHEVLSFHGLGDEGP